METPDEIVKMTRDWLEKAVIGLNLCPFAKAIQNKVRYVVSQAESPEDLLADLVDELRLLAEVDPGEVETTLLIHPGVLTDFLDYNDFLGVAEMAVENMGLDGEIQVASFHPRYQFEGTGPDDIENYTNRSPYPTLHLLREASVDLAVEAFPDAAEIYEKNIETMRRLGIEGWERLGIGKPRKKDS
ncbi:MAG TPA: DUF1415 domain-containing protein [Thermoanaerobaculia bacterium]|nr:DUF1415 domain-containing protein [Thermoanaerobaculia bacterium]